MIEVTIEEAPVTAIMSGDTVEVTFSEDPQDHNDMLHIQGGAVGEYYHFTADQYTKLLALITP
jgi:hypothetical protein